jgi:glutaredoxin
MLFSARRILPLALGLAAAGLSLGAGAQVYRITGPDGRVTFSDRPPPEAAGKASAAPTLTIPAGSSAANGSALPFELRTVASRFPVTLYSGTDCGVCASARNFLTGRGIPFTERTVSSNDDVAALRRISGEARVPFLTVGNQQLHGYSETEWTQYLDAAGYPRNSRLPASYRNPPAAPLVAAQQPQVQRQAEAQPRPAQPLQAPPPVDPPPTNPAGIRF